MSAPVVTRPVLVVHLDEDGMHRWQLRGEPSQDLVDVLELILALIKGDL